MPIQVMYENNTLDTVEPFLLEGLIASNKIKRFLRSEGWVTIGVDPVRKKRISYSGPERRRAQEHVIGEGPSFQGAAEYTLDAAHRTWEEGQAEDEELSGFRLQISDLKTRASQYSKAKKELERLTALIDSSSAAIISKDLDGVITSWNRGAEKLYGYAAHEAVGRNISMLFPSNSSEEILRIFERVKRGEQIEDLESVRLRRDGRQIYISVSLSPIRDSSGKITGLSTIARDITHRKTLERELRFSNAILRTQLETSPDGILVVDDEDNMISFNQRIIDMWKIPTDVVQSRSANQALQSVLQRVSDPEGFLARVSYLNDHRDEKCHEEIALKDGRIFDRYSSPMFGPDGTYYGRVWYFRDITDRKQAEESLLQREAQFKEAQRLAQIGSWDWDAATDTFWCSDEYYRMFHIDPGLETPTFRERLKAYTPESSARLEEAVKRAMETGEPYELDLEFLHADATRMWIMTRGEARRDGSGRIIGLHGTVQNITERRQLEEVVRHQAFYDPLTDLPNRRLFIEHLRLEIAETRRNNKKLAVMFFDLDNFKTINDTLGHDIGDEVLKNVGRRLKSCIRESDRAARLGGDEFNVLLTDIIHPEQTVVSAAKIMESMKKPLLINGYELPVSGSIGISIYPDDGRNAEDLIKKADLAMYYAKEKGKNNFQFYNLAMNVRTRERALLEQPLVQAIERGEFLIRYQPQVDLQSGMVTGVEALIRWQHPVLGLLPPSRFLSLADEAGLILSIDSWMLHAACAQNRAWQQAGLTPLRVSVNLSARQFHQTDLVEMISGVLKSTGLNPQYLDLEITERALMYDVESSILKLGRLTEMGVSFSIDDFGTGCTSLGWLGKLPIQRLKIDASFIHALEETSDNRAIVNAIISLAHYLKMSVVAEGVERAGEAVYLRSQGCDEMQGHVYSRPLPAEECMTLIQKALQQE